jgi:hypothetical protein
VPLQLIGCIKILFTKNTGSKQDGVTLVLYTCYIRISADALAVAIEILLGFPQSLQESAGIVTRLGHGLSSYHTAPYNLDAGNVR